MPTQVQFRGGTTAEHSTFTGVSREVTVDTTKKTLVVHDGTTAGGIPLAKESALTAINPTSTGATTPGTGAFTTLSATGAVTGASTGSFASNLLVGDSGANLSYSGKSIYMRSGQGFAGLNVSDTEARVFASWATTAIPMTFFAGGTEAGRWDTSRNLLPGADNTQTLGSAGKRWSVVYAGTGTINTSDGALKIKRGVLSPAELRAWSSVQWCIYQFIDAVGEKGEDAARLHAGTIAQEVESAFKAEGLDPGRYALWCRDDIYKDALVDDGEEAIDAPVMETVEEDQIVIENGVPVVKSALVDRQKTTLVQVIGKDGKPLVDAEGVPVQVDVPVTKKETVKKTRIEKEFVCTRLGLRYDQCLVFEAAYQRSLAAALNDSLRTLIGRVEVLEAK